MASSERIEEPDGAGIACERLAGAGPQIVLLHAGVADRRSWRKVSDLLNERGVGVAAYDRRGYGETPATEAPFDHLDDLLAVLAAVAPDEPAWLVGNSQGGQIALDLAITKPERVAGLVLIAPAVSGAPEIADDDLDPATRRLSDEIDAAAADGDLDLANELEVRLWLDGPAAPAGRVSGPARDLALAMNEIALATGESEHERNGDRDAWSQLERIDVPTTVIWGELDIPAVIGTCRNLAARMPGCADPVTLADTAHLPGLEHPRRTATAIAEAIGISRAPRPVR
jgi:pimeloyl-ACP methyl ester carboxylesterase